VEKDVWREKAKTMVGALRGEKGQRPTEKEKDTAPLIGKRERGEGTFTRGEVENCAVRKL